MGYKCKQCGWKPDESSFYSTTDDIKLIFDHEKNSCPVKTREKYTGEYK